MSPEFRKQFRAVPDRIAASGLPSVSRRTIAFPPP